MTGTALSYKQVIKNLKDFLEAGSPVFPALEGKRSMLQAKLSALASQEENLSGALLILVLGGTGVGKSTVLNAIAREEELAATGEIRPTTRNMTFYSHEEAQLDAVNRVFRQNDKLQVHRVEGMEHKILIDPPDFDSTVRENRERLREVLDISDLVICTATAERYIDESLFNLLAEFRKTKTFVFLLNKSDQMAGLERVRTDFREHLERGGFADARILAVSARAALTKRLEKASPDEEGEFGQLEEIITKEIDQARIREIKEANIHNLVEHVIEEMSACLPDSPEESVRSWEASVQMARDDLTAGLREETRRGLHLVGRQVSASLASLDVLAFRGPFGWYLAAVERLKNLFTLRGILSSGGDLLAMTENLSRRIRQHIEEDEIESGFHRAVDLAAAGLKDRGVDENTFRRLLPPEGGKGVGKRAVQALTSVVAAKLSEAYERAVGRSWLYIGNIFYNLPPLLFIAHVAYFVTMKYRMGQYVGSEYVIHTALLFLLLLFLEHQLIARVGIARRTGRLLQSLEKDANTRVGAFIDEVLTKPAKEASQEITRALAFLSNARKEHVKINK